MMGRTHPMSGVLTGLVVGKAIGLHTLAELLPFVDTVAGYALLPDIDHPDATVTRLFGRFTRAVSWLLRRGSAALYAVTKGPRDEHVTGTHRHLSHTVVFAFALGGITAALTTWGGPWAVGAVMTLGVLLAVARVGQFALVGVSVGVASWMTTAIGLGPVDLSSAFVHAFTASTGWLGLAVTVGCLTHCLGDTLTESGCPFLFPVPIAGETWYEIRPPKLLRFDTGKKFERRAVFPLLVAGSVLALPGVTPLLIDIITAVLTDLTTASS
jgi:membrane-bound metal-dependent hydrolase YbcI (DUF457 family)